MNNNYPYNPYSYNPEQYQQQYQQKQFIAREKRQARRAFTKVALGVIIYLAVSNIIGSFFAFNKGVAALYKNDAVFSECADMIIVAVSMFVAYLFIKKTADRNNGIFIPVGKPVNKKHALFLIPFGVLACIVGSYATYYLDQLIENVFEVTLTQPEFPEPKTPIEGVAMIIGTALVPAVFEEILLRAGVLQAMRRYGDGFAIFTSAFIFAILHGNLVQTPFAFVAGVAFGYIFIVTGSIWPTVIIHFINNFVSCLVSSGEAFGFSENGLETYFSVHVTVFALLGVIGFALYMADKKRPGLKKDPSPLSLSQKLNAFVFNVPMIICIIIMGIVTSMYIK